MRPVGERGVLVDSESPAALAAVARQRLGPQVVEDVVPGDRTVLITWRRARDRPTRDELADALRPQDVPALPPTAGEAVELLVRYDGEDLEAVARHSGLDAQEVVARHLRSEWRVAFLGFMPGFAYLTGGDPALRVPRRSSPRERVPPGSVALAGDYCAVYPAASPGGWQLIGTCDAVLFDPARAEPALLRAGQPVRFVRA